MGFFKTQKGQIQAVIKDDDKPSNGHNHDLECPHGLTTTTCEKCVEAMKKRDTQDD